MVIVSSAWQVMGGTGAYTHYLTSYRNAYINVSLFRSILHRTQIYILSFPLATLIVQLHYFMEKPVSDVLNLDCTVVCPTLYSLGLSWLFYFNCKEAHPLHCIVANSNCSPSDRASLCWRGRCPAAWSSTGCCKASTWRIWPARRLGTRGRWSPGRLSGS